MAYRGFTDSQIEAFMWVMKTRSATQAAEKMLISQPAVSRLLKQLEQRLEFSLFERIQNRLIPTRHGELFYQEVERSYVGLEQLRKFADRIRNRTEGKLRIVSMPAFALNMLPEATTQLDKIYPELEISLYCYRSEQIASDMIAQRFDIGITTDLQPDPRFQSFHFTLPEVCILPPGHKLAHKDVIHIQDLEGETLIYGETDEQSRSQIEAKLNEMGVVPNKIWMVSLGEIASRLVMKGAGVCIIDCVSAAYAKSLGAVIKPISENFSYDINIILPLDKNMDSSVKMMNKTLMRIIECQIEQYRDEVLGSNTIAKNGACGKQSESPRVS